MGKVLPIPSPITLSSPACLPLPLLPPQPALSSPSSHPLAPAAQMVCSHHIPSYKWISHQHRQWCDNGALTGNPIE